MQHHPGVLLTIEGPDGAGKTSHILAIVEHLQQAGFDVVATREPGGSAVAEKLRSIVLNEQMGARCEVLLFAAARADHLDQTILPAMQRGAVVVCDRFADSTYAYQGAGRGLTEDVLTLEQFVLRGFEPTYTLFFDVTLQESAARLAARAGQAGGESNRLDNEISQFKKSVYRGYQERFSQNPHRMHRIDAMQSIEDVRKDVLSWIDCVLIPRLKAPQGAPT